MKEIKIKEQIILVDDADFKELAKHKWQLLPTRKNGAIYTSYVISRSSAGDTVYMHRFLMSAPKGMFVDHIDGNGLNNQRSNLRFANYSQNQRNRKMDRRNKSGVKGVSWCKGTKKWKAQIMLNGRKLHLGVYDNVEDAGRSYKEAEEKYYGDFLYTLRPV